jgi:cobalt/nickel transport system permease protein
VLTVQCLLFADGGVSVSGLNIINMAMVGPSVGAPSSSCQEGAAAHEGGVTVASGIAAGLAPPLAALMFTLEYALGGTGAASVGTVAAAMIGVHVVIGIGEGVITAMAIASVLAVRPDLVWGAADLTMHPVAEAVAA